MALTHHLKLLDLVSSKLVIALILHRLLDLLFLIFFFQIFLGACYKLFIPDNLPIEFGGLVQIMLDSHFVALDNFNILLNLRVPCDHRVNTNLRVLHRHVLRVLGQGIVEHLLLGIGNLEDAIFGLELWLLLDGRLLWFSLSLLLLPIFDLYLELVSFF